MLEHRSIGNVQAFGPAALAEPVAHTIRSSWSTIVGLIASATPPHRQCHPAVRLVGVARPSPCPRVRAASVCGRAGIQVRQRPNVAAGVVRAEDVGLDRLDRVDPWREPTK